MQDNGIPAAYDRRPDLQLMFRHGASMADEGIVDLFTDAMHRYARDLSPDGTSREPSPQRAAQREFDERLAATLAGAATAFADAARRLVTQ